MAGITDLVKFAVSTAVNAAKKTAGAAKSQTSTGGSGTAKTTSGSTSPVGSSGGGTDWSSQMKSAMDRGASADVVEYLMNQRNNKIAANQQHYDALGISGSDSVSQAAKQYIDQKRQEEQAAQSESFEDFLAGTGYDQYAEQTRAAIQAAVDKAVNGYRDQIDTTNQDSAELARQAYIAKMQGQKNLGQQMAANGYAGGMADSQRIATETDYQNRLGEIEKQKAATVKELESAITNAQLTGDMQTAQELAGYLQNIQSQWAAYVQSQQSMKNQNYWNQQNMDMQNAENARSWAMQQLARGILPDDETLAAAGISKQEAQQQLAMALGQTVGTVAQTPSGTPGRTPTGGGYNNGSLTMGQVQELQRYYNVTPDGLWGSNSSTAADGMTADQAWEAYQKSRMNESYFNAFANSLAAQLQAGKNEAAQSNMASVWDQLSETQKTKILELVGRLGY